MDAIASRCDWRLPLLCSSLDLGFLKAEARELALKQCSTYKTCTSCSSKYSSGYLSTGDHWQSSIMMLPVRHAQVDAQCRALPV